MYTRVTEESPEKKQTSILHVYFVGIILFFAFALSTLKLSSNQSIKDFDNFKKKSQT